MLNSIYTKIILNILFTFGLLPYKIKNEKFIINNKGLLICLLNFIFGFYVNGITLLSSINSVLNNFNSNTNVSEIYPVVAFGISSALSIIIGVLNAYWKQNLTADILNDIDNIYKFILKLNKKSGNNIINIFNFISILYLMFLSTIFYVGYDIVQFFQYNEPIKQFIEYLGVDWSTCIPLCIEVLFATLCVHICICFDEICKSKSDDLELLNMLYLKLCLICEKINQRFGLDFLLSISSAPLILISSLFILLSILLNVGKFHGLNQLYMTSYAISAFARLFYVCYFCRKVSMKAEKTRDILLLRCTTPIHLEPPPSINGIVSEDLKVTFDACGYIKISMVLLGEIIGSVITYLVVLIQFQLMKK